MFITKKLKPFLNWFQHKTPLGFELSNLFLACIVRHFLTFESKFLPARSTSRFTLQTLLSRIFIHLAVQNKGHSAAAALLA